MLWMSATMLRLFPAVPTTSPLPSRTTEFSTSTPDAGLLMQIDCRQQRTRVRETTAWLADRCCTHVVAVRHVDPRDMHVVRGDVDPIRVWGRLKVRRADHDATDLVVAATARDVDSVLGGVACCEALEQHVRYSVQHDQVRARPFVDGRVDRPPRPAAAVDDPCPQLYR